MTKSDLLAAIRREHAALDELLAPMDEAHMLAAAREDGWTAKDILAHITAWEQRVLSWIERWRETGRPQRPEPGVTWDKGNWLNERDHLAAKDKAVADAQSDASASYQAVLLAVEALSDEELAVRPEGPDGPSWSWIVGANAHEHYLEHREEMEAWLKEHPA